MPRKGHTLQAQAQALADLQVQDRQRDRRAGAPLQHLVEVAVARIVIVARISREAQFVEQIPVQYHYLLLGERAPRQAALDRRRVRIDARKVMRDVQVGVCVLRDQQAGRGEAEILPAQQRGKLVQSVLHRLTTKNLFQNERFPPLTPPESGALQLICSAAREISEAKAEQPQGGKVDAGAQTHYTN
jgi:hypothetical protein